MNKKRVCINENDFARAVECLAICIVKATNPDNKAIALTYNIEVIEVAILNLLQQLMPDGYTVEFAERS